MMRRRRTFPVLPVCLAILIACIWGAAWLLDGLPRNDWRHFPTALTAFFIACLAVIWAVVHLFNSRR